MIVFTDLVSNQQILSDSYEQKPFEYNGETVEGLTTVQSKLINMEVGAIDIGANASAEEADEGTDDSAKMENNIISKDAGFGYEGPLSFSKKEFGTYYKMWCKKVKEAIVEKGEKPKPFMTAAKAFLDFVNKEYDNLEFYQTSTFESLICGWWDDEANTTGAPKFIYFKDAVVAEKY